MMKRAVISTLCISLAMALTAGSPLFYDRQKILNKVEFSDAGIDGARIDPLIDESEEQDGNITVSSFTDTNDVGGNDSKEGDSPDATVDEELATERTATEATLNEDSNEATDNVRKVAGTALPKSVTLGTTKHSETDPSNVQGERESVTTPGAASSTTPGRVPNSTEENEVTSSRQSTGGGVTSENTAHSSQMPTTHGDTTTFETSTPPSSRENELESTITMNVNSATTTTTETPENNKDGPIDSSEDTTPGQSINDLVTTSSMIPTESTILATTESTNLTESILSVSKDHSSVEGTETTTVMSTVEEKETTLSTTNLPGTTTQPTSGAEAADGDDTTIASSRSFPVTEATASVFETTLQVESSTLSSVTALTTDSFNEFSETTVLHTTSSEPTTSSPEMATDSEQSAEVSAGTSNPITVVTETSSTDSVTTTVVSDEQRTTTEVQENPPDTTLGAAVTITPATVSSIESSEFTGTTAKDVSPTTITENSSAEIGVTREATVDVSQSLEEMSTAVNGGHSSESGESLMTSTVENVLTTNAIVEELASTVTATTVLKSGSDLETSVTSPDTTTTEVTTIVLATETPSSAEATASTEAEEERVSTITSTVTNVQDTGITTTATFVQHTTAALVEQTEETTTSVVVENFSTTTDNILTETSPTAEITTEEVTTSKAAETEATTTEEVIRETTIIAVTNIEENATIVSDVDQSGTTSEMMTGASVTVETSKEATAEAVTFTPQEQFTVATTTVSPSGEAATNDEFKTDFPTTAEPSTTKDATETATREIIDDVSSTTNIVITTVQTPEHISTVGTDAENTSDAERSDSEEDTLTTTEQIATLPSTVVVEITEKTHDIITEEASTTAATDTTNVFFTEALTRTTEEVLEQSTTSVPDLGGVTTNTAEATTISQESAEKLTIKRVVEPTEEEMNSVSIKSGTTIPSSTMLVSTTLAVESTVITTARSETITQDNSLVSLETTEPTTTISASTASRDSIEEHENGSEVETNPQHTESTSPSEMTTKENSLVSFETTDPTTTMSAPTTSRSNIAEHEKGSEDVTNPEHTESTSPEEITMKESSHDLVKTTTDYTTETDTTVRSSTSFTTSTTPLSVAASEDQLYSATKDSPVTSVTTKEVTEVDPVGIVSLASEAMITTTVLPPVTSSARTGLPNVSESVQRSTKNIALQNSPDRSDDLAGATIPPEKELPSTSDALSTPAEDSGSTAHTIHSYLLILVPVVMAQLRGSLGAST